MKLIITEHGDPSVGIFDQWFIINCPFNEDATEHDKEFFRAEILKIYQEFTEQRLSAEYSIKDTNYSKEITNCPDCKAGLCYLHDESFRVFR